jgi:large subunit ribosomal protein L4
VKLTVYDTKGAESGSIEADDSVFGIEPNRSVIHQAYLAQMANRRAGSAKAKRRYEVTGSTAKLRRQKGLGRARMGSITSSSRVGGGVAHGPRPHSFVQALPKKMRRLAIRSVLSDRAAAGSLTVVSQLAPEEPKTRLMHGLLGALGADRKVLIVPATADEAIVRAGRNLGYANVVPADYLNVVDLVDCHRIVADEAAIRRMEQLWCSGSAPLDEAAASEEVACCRRRFTRSPCSSGRSSLRSRRCWPATTSTSSKSTCAPTSARSRKPSKRPSA